jgi:uncharacterized oxidoreductase
MKVGNNTILITGGGSGIGLSLARAFLRSDNTVIVCGRNPVKLEAVKKQHPGIITFVCDIANLTLSWFCNRLELLIVTPILPNNTADLGRR